MRDEQACLIWRRVEDLRNCNGWGAENIAACPRGQYTAVARGVDVPNGGAMLWARSSVGNRRLSGCALASSRVGFAIFGEFEAVTVASGSIGVPSA